MDPGLASVKRDLICDLIYVKLHCQPYNHTAALTFENLCGSGRVVDVSAVAVGKMLARGSAGGEAAGGGAGGVTGPSGGGREGGSIEGGRGGGSRGGSGGVWEGGSEAFEQAGGRAVSWADAVLRICEE